MWLKKGIKTACQGEESVNSLVAGGGSETERVKKLISELDLKIEHLTSD